MRYRIVLSYNGAPFCGWQRQPGAPSVQETLETALYTLLGEPVAVTGAGRTDTGVSAVGYVAHFDAPAELDATWIRYKLNAILPPSMAVHSVERAADYFHARFDATRREYTYFLHREKDPFAESWSFYFGYPSLDFELMNRAAAMLLGTHDFSCFQKSGSDNKTTICTVYEAGWHPYTPTHISIMGNSCNPVSQIGLSEGFSETDRANCPSRFTNRPSSAVFRNGAAGSSPLCSEESGERLLRGELPDSASRYWYFRIAADRFLRNMVRCAVGTILEVGRGKRPLSAEMPGPAGHDGKGTGHDGKGTGIPPFDTLIDGGPRTRSGESAPGHALFLSGIEY